LHDVTASGRLVDLLKHPEYVAALAHPFTTVMLEIFPLRGSHRSFSDGESSFADEEEQFHEVAAYLFKTYGNRNLTFVLQHWEGDWMLRRSEAGTWAQVPAEEIKRRCNAFIRFLAARQRGVERARPSATTPSISARSESRRTRRKRPTSSSGETSNETVGSAEGIQ